MGGGARMSIDGIRFEVVFNFDREEVVRALTQLRKCLSVGVSNGAESEMAEMLIGDIDSAFIRLAAAGVE